MSYKNPSGSRKVKDLFFPSVIFTTVVFVAFKNYTPGTWLLGWDNLVPELNFKLNIVRSLSAVWQEYQGVGLLGGMAHAADLPRQIILLISSLLLPLSFLRYFWTFLMLITGPLGVYFLVKGLLHTGPVTSSSHPTSSVETAAARDSLRFYHTFAAFASAIFYIFNFVTLQTFFTPFETFTSFYGFFPWLILFALNYLKKGSIKSLVVFALISLAATPAFYVQTLFVVYAIFLAIFCLETILRDKKEGIIKSFKLALVTFFINAFWLLPVGYFTLTNGNGPSSSHINSIATPETELMNRQRNDFVSLATLKGYWFDYYDWNKDSTKYDFLYKDWIGFSNNPLVEKASIGIFILSILGIGFWAFPIGRSMRNQQKFLFSFIILGFISFYMLSGRLPTGVPILSEAFRNAFTKWSNAATLIIAIGTGYFIFFISNLFKGKTKSFMAAILSVGLVIASIYTTKPFFDGKLIADTMKVTLPNDYSDAINFFGGQDKTARIAILPLTDFWGWQFNDWGYRGSGFLWYGIHQPVLSRTFDVWSLYNEEFYKEINYAFNFNDNGELGKVLFKYQVSYVLFDDSVVEPGNPEYNLKLKKQHELLETPNWITKVDSFGKISIYKINLPEIKSFISAPMWDFGSSAYDIGRPNTPSVTESFSAEQGYPAAKNCELNQIGRVVKERRSTGNYYAAFNGGVSCDYFYYSTLSYTTAYKMRIKGKNISGRSLKFYLYNVGNKSVDLVELLPEGDFDEIYEILPNSASIQNGSGYTLNVETRSFGKIASENTIKSIEFYPVTFERTLIKDVDNNNLIIKNVKKSGTWGYKIDAQGYGLLQLGQGFDGGWIGFSINKSGLNGSAKIYPHFKFNGWSNAWKINTDLSSSFTVYLIYWPQLLQWIGSLMGAVTFVLLIIRSRR